MRVGRVFRLRHLVTVSVLCGLLLAGGVNFKWSAHVIAAACTLPSTDYGTVTQQATIPANTGQPFRIWSRLAAADTASQATNTYLLEVDSGTPNATCYTVGGSSVPIYPATGNKFNSDGSNWFGSDINNAPIQLPMSAGAHTIKMIGNKANVLLDRLIFTADTACQPTGTGDNCVSPPDTTPPVVSLTAPADTATVSGTTVISATATDNSGVVSKVEFYVDGALINTATTSPYSYNWDTTTVGNGSHVLTAKAYDPSNNVASSNAVTVTVNNPVAQPDLVVTGISWAPPSPATGNAVTFTATIKNQGTAATPGSTALNVAFSVDGSVVSNGSVAGPLAVGASMNVSASSAWSAAAGSHTVLVNVDPGNLIPESNKNNNTLSTSMSVSSPDTTPPTVSLSAPAAGTKLTGTSDIISATASDNVGVTRVEFYVDGSTLINTATTAPYNYNWNPTTVSSGSHSLTAKAYDAAGNSATSTAVTVTVPTYIAEDVNQDCTVNIFDLSLVIGKYGQTTSLGRADVNGDGKVDIFDLSRIIGKYGQTVC